MFWKNSDILDRGYGWTIQISFAQNASCIMPIVTACSLLAALLFLLVLPCFAAGPDDPINPFQAAERVGRLATVCGKVANTYYSCFVAEKPTFINFGKPYPDQVFSVAIMGEDREKFDDCPEKLFAGRDVCVTGLIKTYEGKPVMKVKDQAQVQWND